jgi:hypothetical protein
MMNHEEAFKLARRRDAAYADKVEFAAREHVWTPAHSVEWQRICAELEAVEAERRQGWFGR